MTPRPLSQLYSEAVAFDERRAKDDCSRRIAAFGKMSDLFSLHVESARFEHAYRQPIDACVARLIEACEVDSYTQNVISANAVREALAQLRKALEGEK